MADPWADFIPAASTPTADPWADFIPAKPDVATDVGKSAVVGAGKGVIGTLTAARDIPDALSYGTSYLMAKAAEAAGLLPKGKTASDFMAASQQVGKDMPRELLDIPTGQQVQKGVEQVTGKFYEPQTTEGKYAKTGAEFGTGALLTGPKKGVEALINVARNGIVPGLASEGAGQATEGTGYEPLARGAAGLATGTIGSLATRPNIETRMTAQATRGATDADINSAMRLMSDSNQRGVKLTWPEALQQVTGGATQAGRLQRVVEGTKEGGAIMAPAMAQRPAQVAGAVNNTLDNIAPASLPTPTGLNAQKAADQSIGQVRKDINAAETPYYDAAKTKTVPPQDLQFISQDPAFQQALNNVRNDPIRNKDIAGFGVQEVPTLIAVRKELARMEGNALKPGNQGNPDKELARGITPIRDRLDQIITQTAPEYGQALGVGAGLRDTKLAPLNAGPMGKVASTDDLGTQVKALFPSSPMENTARETSGAVGLLNAHDATVAPSLARQHLASNFAEASQSNVPGANQWGGAKFASQVAGNPLQREVLMENLSALPNGGAKADDVRGLLDTLQATGKRQQPGSMTAFNASDLKDMAGGGLLSGAADSIKTGNPMSLMKQMKEGFDRSRLGARSESVARGLLGSPEEVKMLLTKARQASPEGRAAREIIGILGGNNQNLRLAHDQ